MPNIVIEGCDGSGKSTLAIVMQERMTKYMRIQSSEGPGKSNEEVTNRCIRYSYMNQTIFDRHPFISQTLYNSFRADKAYQISPAAWGIAEKQVKESLIIYCPMASFKDQIIKEGETEDHIKLMRENFDELKSAYDRWALGNAHLIYRKGDDPKWVIRFVNRFVQDTEMR